MGEASLDRLREKFRHFAQVCEGQSPLYSALSTRIADAPEVLALAGGGIEEQPPPNLLFGAVHDLLLAGVAHDLTEYYPSVGGRGAPCDAWPAFRDFCRRYAREIGELVSSRRVQTNEVGRCGVLLPAFAAAFRQFDRPLHLIEIGASAGLGLIFDQYRYEYSDGRVAGPASAAVIRTRLDGEGRPDVTIPPVADRVGVDIAPVDITDDSEVRWLEALIWPDEIARLQLLRNAIALARAGRSRIIAGDGIELLAALLAEVGGEHLPCVYHSHAIYQMTTTWRDAFQGLVTRLACERDLACVSLEWLDDDAGPRLHLTTWSGGEARRRHLADCHHHGRWLRWIDR